MEISNTKNRYLIYYIICLPFSWTGFKIKLVHILSANGCECVAYTTAGRSKIRDNPATRFVARLELPSTVRGTCSFRFAVDAKKHKPPPLDLSCLTHTVRRVHNSNPNTENPIIAILIIWLLANVFCNFLKTSNLW